MKMYTINEAWNEVKRLIPDGVQLDKTSSNRAGYPVYRSTSDRLDYVCDLGTSLEVNLHDGNTVRINLDTTTNDNNESEVITMTNTTTNESTAIILPTTNDNANNTNDNNDNATTTAEGILFDLTPFGDALSEMYKSGNKKMMGAKTLESTAGMLLAEYKLFMVDLQNDAIEYDRLKDAYSHLGKRTAKDTNILKAARTNVYNRIAAICEKAGCLAEATDADFVGKLARDLLSTKTIDNGDGTTSGGEKEFTTTRQAKFIKGVEWLIGSRIHGMTWDKECMVAMTSEQRTKMENRIKKEKEKKQKKEEERKAADPHAKRAAEKAAMKEIVDAKKNAEKKAA